MIKSECWVSAEREYFESLHLLMSLNGGTAEGLKYNLLFQLADIITFIKSYGLGSGYVLPAWRSKYSWERELPHLRY